MAMYILDIRAVNIWISFSNLARLLTSSYLWISEPSARERGLTISKKSIFKLSPVSKLLFQNVATIHGSPSRKSLGLWLDIPGIWDNNPESP